ncbi:MAG: pyridoxamine 5'-phosphate oxidase family protein [Polyangiaceae bacterium]
MAPDGDERFYERLKEFETAMLVTHAGDTLHARPMSIADAEPDCDLWFITGGDTLKAHEIEADGRVQVICQDGRSYLTVTGTARLVTDRAKLDELWQETMRTWFPKGKDDPSLVLVMLTAKEGEYWDHSGLSKLKYHADSAPAPDGNRQVRSAVSP